MKDWRKEMRMVIPTAAVMASAAGAAGADGYPDLRGTWRGDLETVLVDIKRYHTQGLDAAIFGGFPVTLVIARQDGRRFAGRVDVDGEITPIVGVLTSQSTMQWSQDGTLVDGRLLDAETIDHCYVRPNPSAQSAACGVLKREGGG
jgi:hypothetical protein